MNFVLIDTGGKQRYIFESNRLRENIGASELVHDACTTWVHEAMAQRPGAYQEIYLCSGKALVAADCSESARSLVFAITSSGLVDAPGLEIYGHVSGDVKIEHHSVVDAISRLHLSSGQGRSERGHEFTRFQRLPCVADCDTSVFPAADVLQERAARSQSHVSIARFAAGKDGKGRLHDLFPHAAKDIDDLEKRLGQLPWLGVVHIDGNGFGQLFHDLAESAAAQPEENSSYLCGLRALSEMLDRVIVQAFKSAAARWGEELIVPTIVAGDDLTFLCDGSIAIDLAVDVLREIERSPLTLSEEKWALPAGILAAVRPPFNPELLAQLDSVKSQGRLTACAGIAITKPHYPFWSAYELASELTDSAKQVKRVKSYDGRTLALSALDYHVLLDGAADPLDELRARAVSRDGNTALCHRPIVCTELEGQLDGMNALSASWCEHRTLRSLRRLVAAITSQDARTGRRVLARSQLKSLGQKLADDPATAARNWERWKQAEPGTAALKAELGDELTFEVGDKGPPFATRFLDALELEEFLDPTDEPVEEIAS